MSLFKLIFSLTAILLATIIPNTTCQVQEEQHAQRGLRRRDRGGRDGRRDGMGGFLDHGFGFGHGHHGNPRDKNVTFIDDVCENDVPTTCTLPPHPRLNGTEEGIFVCRTRYNNRMQEDHTFTMCIPPDRGIEGDACGCCDGICPEECGCDCPLTNRRCETVVDDNGQQVMGSLITVDRMDHDGDDGDDGDEELCVPKHAAMMMVERRDGVVACATCD